jgi:hypothetical protein
MPILIFLRQYGLREYAITLAIAALAGLGVATLINSAPGGAAGPPAVLKTKQELADASSRVLTTRVFRPVSQTEPAPKPAVHHRARHHHRVVTQHRIVVAAAPAPAPKPTLQPVSRPAPVVQKRAPVVQRPAPVIRRPAPKPAPKPSGGSVQFDDSG